jgi:hypothetical protein
MISLIYNVKLQNAITRIGVDYKVRLLEIQRELDALNKEAAVLAETIANNLKGVI